MSWIMVDIEADGPAPGLFSMISLGAVVVRAKRDGETYEPDVSATFYGRFRPLPDAAWVAQALEVAGHTREECLAFPDPKATMGSFQDWLNEHSKGSPRFISDNNGFDWQFVNYYFWRFLRANPFGHSSTNLGSLYKGLAKDGFQNFKHLRTTAHTHHPVDDAIGNVEALVAMVGSMGLRWRLE